MEGPAFFDEDDVCAGIASSVTACQNRYVNNLNLSELLRGSHIAAEAVLLRRPFLNNTKIS